MYMVTYTFNVYIHTFNQRNKEKNNALISNVYNKKYFDIIPIAARYRSCYLVFLSFIHISLVWQFSWFLEHFKRCSLTLKNHNSRCDNRKIISNISKFKLAFPLPNELQMIIRRLFFIYEAIKRSNTFFWDTQLFWIVF